MRTTRHLPSTPLRALLTGLALALVTLLGARAEATCWMTRDGKGYCCAAPQSRPTCHRYTAEELRKRREEKQRRIREAAKAAERRRKAHLAREQARRQAAERRRQQLERAKIGRQQRLREFERLRRLRRDDPKSYRRAMRARRRAAYRREERARRARLARLRRASSRGAWARGGGVEFGLGPALGIRSDDNTDTARGAVGLETSIGLLWRSRYNGRSLLGRGSLAMAALPVMGPLLGFIFVPRSTFLGNEHGVTLQGQLTWPTGSGDRFRALLLVAPRLYVSPTQGHVGGWRRWRFNSLVGFLLPKVGLEIDSAGTVSWALEVYNLAYGVRLGEHLCIQIDAAALLRQSHGEKGLVAGANIRLRMFVF
jgi:hypothetical protein